MVHLPNPGVQAQVDREDEDATFDSRDLMSCMTLRGRNTLWTITDRYMSRLNLNMLVAKSRWKMKKKKYKKLKRFCIGMAAAGAISCSANAESYKNIKIGGKL